MAYHSQMIKGLLEGCVLKILAEEETYGYSVAERLRQSGFAELNEGSVYPVLVRLEKRKLLKSQMKDSPLGPRRKYYRLSAEGRLRLEEFVEAWNEVRDNVDRILKGDVDHEEQQ